jgi:ABC-type antimicrobial peptide transport system permease subunit
VKLVRGRTFASEDLLQERSVAVISERVRTVTGRAVDLVGTQLGEHIAQPAPTVIGVVADIRTDPLALARPTVYILVGMLPADAITSGIGPIAARASAVSTFVIRSADPGGVERAVRSAIPWASARLDVTTTEQRVHLAVATQKSAAIAIGVLGLIGIVLSMCSLYVLVQSILSSRMHEFGIRVAMGATMPRLALTLFSDTLCLIVIGLALGAGLILSGRSIILPLLRASSHFDAQTITFPTGLVLLVSLAVMLPLLFVLARQNPGPLLRED